MAILNGILKALYSKLALLETAKDCAGVLPCLGMWLTEEAKSGHIDLTGFIVLGSYLIQEKKKKKPLYAENHGHPRDTCNFLH